MTILFEVKNIITIIFIVFFQGHIIAQSNTQTNTSKEAIIFIQPKDSVNEDMLKQFEATQNRLFTDPGLPDFVISRTNKRFALGIGGYIKLTASSDFDGISHSVDFLPSLIDVPQNKMELSQFRMDAATSRLYLKIIGDTKQGNLIALVETDFRGSKSLHRMRKAYIAYCGFLLGKDWSTFTDLDASPPFLDFGGANSYPVNMNNQLRYVYELLKHFKLAISLEEASLQFDEENQQAYLRQNWPDLICYLRYENQFGHLQWGNLFRKLQYKGLIDKKQYSILGYGASVSSKIKLSRNVYLYCLMVCGKGIEKYVADVSILNLDLVADPSNPNKLIKLPVSGVYVSLQYNFTKKLYSTATVSQVRIFHNSQNNPEKYRKGTLFSANVFYNLTQSTQIAIEYMYGARQNQNLFCGHSNRLAAMIQYNF